MTILDYCKKLVMFSNLEMKIVQILIQQYLENLETFTFLKEIDLNQVQFFWYNDSNQNVLGGFHFFGYSQKNRKYVIYVNDFFKQQHDYNNSFSRISLVFETIIHELKHYWQMKKMGSLLYFVLQLPILRQFTIQRSARKISNEILSMKIAQSLTIVKQFVLKIKYDVSDVYLNRQQLQLKKKLLQKNIDLVEWIKDNEVTSLKCIYDKI